VQSICEINQKCHKVFSLGRAYSSFLFGSRNFPPTGKRVAIFSPKDRKVERKQVIFGSLTMEAADCTLGPLSVPILGSNCLINRGYMVHHIYKYLCNAHPHCKKSLSFFLSTAGLSLTKLSLAGNNLIILWPGRIALIQPHFTYLAVISAIWNSSIQTLLWYCISRWSLQLP